VLPDLASQPSVPPQPHLTAHIGLPEHPLVAPSGSWGYQAPFLPQQAPGQPSSTRRTLRLVGTIALSIAVALTGGFGLSHLVSSGPKAPAAAPAPTYPAAWDARVAPLVDYVEKTRGLTFDRPVFVDFLTPAEYTASVHVPSPTQADRLDAQRHAGLYRSVGLISGNVDLAASGNQIADQGTLAYYSHRTKRIDVRGTDLTVGLRVTLVHELTHVLQDQHFDLTRIEGMADSGQQTAFQTLFEGDAVRIEDAYMASLSPADKTALDAEQNSQKGAAETGLTGVPTALVTLFGAPYDLGAELLAVLNNKSGNTAVDDAFRNPPIDEAQVFNPWLYLTQQQPDKLAQPSLAKSEKKFDSGDFGALSWYVTLAQRIDPHLALQAADAWAGDSYVAFEQNQKVCVRSDVNATSAATSATLAAAFTQWAATMPGSGATVTPRGKGIEINSCDPGIAADLAPIAGAQGAMVFPVARTDIALSFIKKGATTAQARCAGNAVVLAYSEADLSDPTGAPFTSPAGALRLQKTIAVCRGAT
jgi:hypothetical protein